MKILLPLLCSLALAQAPTTPAPTAAPATPGAPSAEAKAPSPALRALELPLAARALRNAGVPDADVRGALDAAKSNGLKADEATDLVEATAESVGENGPVDNFGAFVQSKLAEGLRGQDLAAAIKAEHAARGKGKGAGHGHGGPDGGKHDGEGPHGPGDGHGRPEGKGPPDGARAEGSRPGGEGKHEGGKGMHADRPEGGRGEGKGADAERTRGGGKDGAGKGGRNDKENK